MMGSFEISGLDELEKKLKKMEKATKDLSGTHEVPLSELLTTSFMEENSSFSSIDQLLSNGGFGQEEFDKIPKDQLDKHISVTTKFNSWEEMLNEATSQYVSKKLGF